MDIGYSLLLYMGEWDVAELGKKQRNLRWGLAIKSVSSKPKVCQELQEHPQGMQKTKYVSVDTDERK